MNITDLYYILENGGITALLIVLFIYFIWKFSPKIISFITKQYQIYEKRQKNLSLDHRRNCLIKIRQILSDLMCRFKSNRVVLCEYHNGGKNLAGLSFLNVSATSEVNYKCTASLGDYLQKIPSHLFINLINDLEKDCIIYVSDIEKIKNRYNYLYTLFRDNGTKSMIISNIAGVNQQIGFVVIGINNDQQFSFVEISKMLNTDIQALSNMLDYENIKKI